MPTLCLNEGDKSTLCKLCNKIFLESRVYQEELNRFDCAIDKGAHIINASYGVYAYSQAEKDAIEATRALGIIFVAAAGNYGLNNDIWPLYPASHDCPNIISVAATDHNDSLWQLSNYGTISVDVAAPGVNIYSTVPYEVTEYDYLWGTGTSQAAPHVTGLAALIKSCRPTINWQQIKSLILKGANNKDSLHNKVLTSARINAFNALTTPDIDSFTLGIQSSPSDGAYIEVNPQDLNGEGSGYTPFGRTHAPYTIVLLTAPATHDGNKFGCWELEGVPYSLNRSIPLTMDYDHVLEAVYITISGTVKTASGEGLKEVTITFSEGEGDAITDLSGNYSHSVSWGWSGIATPSKKWFVFTPLVRSYSNVTSHQFNQDYTATPVKYISGTVKTIEDEGLGGVVITFSNGGGTITTDSTGNYSMPVNVGWSGTATPSKGCYTFSPSDRTYSNVISDQTNQGYNATFLTYAISGYVWRSSPTGDIGLGGVVMDGLPGNPASDEEGRYIATVDCGWSGTVTPIKEGYTFNPPSVNYGPVGADFGQNYWATLLTYTISGKVSIAETMKKMMESSGLSGVVMQGLPENPTTEEEGNYGATVDYGWAGTVTPAKEGYRFDPSNRTYTKVTSDQTSQNYSAVWQYTLTIVAGPGGTTDPSPGSHIYDVATQVSVRAIPNSGYRFTGWSGDASGTTNPITITMDSDKSVTANFTKEEEKKKGGCFIATAAYGSPLHSYVRILRDFRDKYLMPSKLGRALVDIYYKYSPSVAGFIMKHKVLKAAVRFSLMPVIVFSYSMLHFGLVFTTFMFLFISLLPIPPILFCLRRMRRVEAKDPEALASR